MGFFDAIKAVIQSCPKQRQTLLFSATYPEDIKKLSKQFMRNPREVFVQAEPEHYDIEQVFYDVKTANDKLPLLTDLLLHHNPSSTLIFCNTKQLTTDLATQLAKSGFSALALNGDMEQVERDQVLIRFVNQSCSILVATDVAARGIDIKELPAVINYELAFEKDVYTHRIGRTGRAGHKGLAISFVLPCDAERILIIKENATQPLVWAHKKDMVKGNKVAYQPEMVTVCLNAGKKDKIRAGDILGALTKDAGLPGSAIGKIDITALSSYVAIHKSHIDRAYHYLQDGKLKGRKVQVKRLR
jgi:ATP-independent RNA helicase DbpA